MKNHYKTNLIKILYKKEIVRIFLMAEKQGEQRKSKNSWKEL